MIDSPVKIAVVDDNEVMVDLLVDLLENMPNYEVVGQAYDGKAGVELISKVRPDVVILDLCMPYIDGLGVMEAFQAEKDTYFPKFIITTCVGQEHITAKAMRLGATYYMVKPFDYDNFMNRLNELSFDLKDSNVQEEPAVQVETKSISSKLSEILHLLGVPPHTKGYAYLKDAILLVHDDVKYMMKITKSLYPTVAANHDTTASRVERAIRNTIELTLTRGDHELLVSIFGHSVKQANSKLTNSEFIAIIAEKLKSGN